ncbi:pentatricopeptide repeat-containing protein At4g31070, mitochondrial [Mercurialis annua]|uniref:pentatricopeptide repeat-containing protein At4g31070, mitochondrial n=1 Tax=Mercurialis annua TaxID=3986 RepID=UPI00215F77F9|nr:pentatricopeptide repeat-containing protein At4g31070, mitochondrial [Mercurialis annua]
MSKFKNIYLIKRFTSTLCSTKSISTIHFKINNLVSKGFYHQTLQFYKEELHCSHLHAANAYIFPTLIKACSSSSNHHHFGIQLHGIILKSGLESDPVISNSLISFYAKSSHTEFALEVFDTMPVRDTISWNSIINCCLQNGYFFKGFIMFKEMYNCGLVPKSELVASVVSVCAELGHMKLGRAIHGLIIVGDGTKDDVFVLTSLVDWYFKSGDPVTAFCVFDQIEVRNEVSWTAFISGCIANLDYNMAVDCFRDMQINGVRPNRVTMIAILPAFAELGYVMNGREIHAYAFRNGFDSDRCFSSSLIHMYCRSGEGFHLAKVVFERSEVKDVVMWSSIIGSYSRSKDSVEALNLCRQMREEGIEPNYVTLLAVITACTTLTSLRNGYGIHGYIVKCGLNVDVFVENALMHMYSKCGCLVASHQIFEEMHIKDSVSWSTLITGYGIHGYGEEALCIFREMQEKGVEIDAVTFLAVLSACNHSGLVQEGQQIFDNVKKDGKFPLTIEHYACLVDLLGKSGNIDDAFRITETMPMKPSTRIWSSLVSACKAHGQLEAAEMLAQWLITLEPSNAANHTSLSMIFAESGNWSGIEEVKRLMRAQGLNKCYGFSQISVRN